MLCKNCHTELPAESDFCNRCGGKVIRNRLTFRNLFEHISETFFNYDNKLLRTFIDLFKKPEVVIGGYINGVRKRYVNPISLFGLTLTLVGLEWLFLSKFFPEQMNLSSLAAKGNESGVNNVFGFIQDYSSIVMMLLVPVYAIISRTVFFDKKEFNYVEHIVAFTYITSVISLLGAIFNIFGLSFGADLGMVIYINLPVQIIYISYCFKRLYNVTLAQIIGRALLSFIVYMIIYVLILVIVVLVLYLTQGTEGLKNLLENFRPK